MSTAQANPGAPAAEPELLPVPGPSAVAGGARRFFNLLWVMAVTEFKLTFHGTSLGYLWSLARPLLMFGVLLAVFTQVFRFGDDVKDYPALLLLNIMLFSLFSEATQRAVTSVMYRENIVRKAQFPRLVIPLSTVLTELLRPGPEPDRRAGLHHHLRGRPDVDMAAAAGRGPRPAGGHGRGLDDRLRPVPALPRHGADLVGARDRALLRARRSSIRSR